jgi:phage gp46-like protein
MTDISTTWIVETGTGDWSISGGALASGDDLATAVLISLFTDRLADADDVPPDGSNDRRGWWGDDGEDVPIGSRLWLLDRSRLDVNVANNAQIYMGEALQWLIDDVVAAAVKVTTVIAGQSQLNALVNISRSDGTAIPLQFNWVWRQN